MTSRRELVTLTSVLPPELHNSSPSTHPPLLASPLIFPGICLTGPHFTASEVPTRAHCMQA